MFNPAISRTDPPYHLSSDTDPLFRFHRWKASQGNLDVMEMSNMGRISPCHICPSIE